MVIIRLILKTNVWYSGCSTSNHKIAALSLFGLNLPYILYASLQILQTAVKPAYRPLRRHRDDSNSLKQYFTRTLGGETSSHFSGVLGDTFCEWCLAYICMTSSTQNDCCQQLMKNKLHQIEAQHELYINNICCGTACTLLKIEQTQYFRRGNKSFISRTKISFSWLIWDCVCFILHPLSDSYLPHQRRNPLSALSSQYRCLRANLLPTFSFRHLILSHSSFLHRFIHLPDLPHSSLSCHFLAIPFLSLSLTLSFSFVVREHYSYNRSVS